MSAASPLIEQHRAYAHSLMHASRQAAATSESRPGAAVGQRAASADSSELEFIPWGVPMDANGTQTGADANSNAEAACELIATFGEVEAEYAAIRRGAGLLDSPHRGTLRLGGQERVGFLNRMATQELKGFAGGDARGQTREAFWLNRKGRIDADLFLIEAGGDARESMLIDVDVANAAAAAKSLDEFIFTEDVEVRDASDDFHHIAVHGRLARDTIAAAANDDTFDLCLGAARTLTIDSVPVVIARHDQTGEVGYEVIVPRESATGVWEFLLAADHIVGGDKRRVRPIGWHAFNIARIEAGTPLFNIDFGPTNLPHETGELLRRRVSFTKGCYLGQEVVARMESRGHSKQTLVGLRIKRDLLPVSGSQVFALGEDGATTEPIGAVTSSALSPMLGAQPIALAMIRNAHARHGATVMVSAEGEQTEAIIGPMRFWPPDGDPERGQVGQNR